MTMYMIGIVVSKQEDYEDLCHMLYLYMNWRFVTGQLTTKERTLLADSIDAAGLRAFKEDNPFIEQGIESDEEPLTVDRWWLK